MSFLFNDIPVNSAVERFVDLSFEVSERIIRLLMQRGMSQRDLAIKLGKKDSEISKWLTGNHNFTLRTIAAIETALDEKFLEIEGLDSEFSSEMDKSNTFVTTISKGKTILKESHSQHGSGHNVPAGTFKSGTYKLDNNPFDAILSGESA